MIWKWIERNYPHFPASKLMSEAKYNIKRTSIVFCKQKHNSAIFITYVYPPQPSLLCCYAHLNSQPSCSMSNKKSSFFARPCPLRCDEAQVICCCCWFIISPTWQILTFFFLETRLFQPATSNNCSSLPCGDKKLSNLHVEAERSSSSSRSQFYNIGEVAWISLVELI